MNETHRELTHRLRNSVNCLGLAVALLPKLDETAERAEALEIIERQAAEAEDAAGALVAVAEE